MDTLDFHFDYVSPYAYLAWTQMHALAARHGVAVRPIPTLFGALLSANGNVGPAEIPAKRAYMFRDVWRSAHALGVPFRLPPSHPFNPLLALRVSALDVPDAQRRRIVDVVFGAVWGRGEPIDTRAWLVSVLDAGGLAGGALADAAETDDAKARLRASTDAALAAGVFGVPTVRVRETVFWGLDSLPHLERFLRGEDPVPLDYVVALDALKPSAVRKR